MVVAFIVTFVKKSLYLNSIWVSKKQLAWRKLCPRQKHKLRLTLQAKNSSRRRDVDLLRAGIGPAQLNSSLSYTFFFPGGYCLA